MSRRALVVLSALVVLLAIIVVVDRPPRGEVVVAQRLLPEGVTAQLTRLELGRPGGQRTLLLAHDGVLALAEPSLPTDAAQVRDLLGALELFSWRRRVPASDAAARGLAPPALTITLGWPGHQRVIGIGKTEPATGRTWIDTGEGDHALVDAFSARELDRHADDLRSRDVFDLPQDRLSASGLRLTVGDAVLRLHGDPARVEGPGGQALADPAEVGQVISSLRRLRMTRFLPDDRLAGQPPSVSMQVEGQPLEVYGSCPAAASERLVRGRLGVGCVPAGALEVLTAAVGDWTALVDRQLLPDTPRGLAKVILERGAERQVLTGPAPWQGPGQVDAAAVDDWFRDLSGLVARQVVPATAADAAPAGAPTLHLFRAHGGEVVLTLLPAAADGSTRIRRAGDDVVLAFKEPRAAVRELFTPAPWRFAPRELLPIDGTRITSLVQRHLGAPHQEERVERGQSLADVRVVEPVTLPADAEAWGQLTDALTDLHALGFFGQVPFAPRLQLIIAVDAAPGAPAATYRLDLGAADRPDGSCLGQVAPADRPADGPVAILPATICARAGRPLATRALWESGATVVAITVDGVRLEQQGGVWRGPGSEDSDGLSAAVAALATPTVTKYQKVSGPPRVIVELDDGSTVRLAAHGRQIGRVDRAVTHATPALVCATWPKLCS
jgi:hypothetical protein